MKLEKSTIYGIGIFLVLVLGGYFLLGNDSENYNNGNVANTGGENVQEITIGMKNYNYYPNTINVKVNVPVRIKLDESVSGCFRDFTIREFGIRKHLQTPTDYVEFTPTKTGTFTFACSMGMGTGKLIVS